MHKTWNTCEHNHIHIVEEYFDLYYCRRTGKMPHYIEHDDIHHILFSDKKVDYPSDTFYLTTL